jgi:hypothetical protein
MTQPQHQQSLDTLNEIRSLMERSSRFISLSGLSGVSAGIFALLGAGIAAWYLGRFEAEPPHFRSLYTMERWGMSALLFFALDAAFVFIGAVVSAIYFTTRKAKRKAQPVWDALTRRLLLSLAIPLLSGGIFILALLYHGLIGLVAPCTLLFYGLGLVNASKYTLDDVRYLGYAEIALGLLTCFNIGYGLESWVLGFGVLHIAYGLYMYYKYERA